ncbi:hypothetical protein COCC4DRAFT_69511 [Bipolaris maydis ATCC 48331]|uniref:Uncharacterized protein n=2 Tax=Cochliobolus heterostrophus TaxID=5016 RepID=N4XUS1_COCH4|nr:uncharacterized protein COCC4DRAFT_69511 [Bipolaris maydis ATCC 48331]ENI08922.1 hypothetical protein COCC4DRAFT_69511 [Bipolaris maydis ATCC 48331]
MSLTTLPSLPEPILHIICIYLTPDRPSVNDSEHGQSPTLYRPIISLSLTAHALNRISSTHIATNMSLTWGTVRWDLFLRTIQENPVYASTVKYLKLSELSIDKQDLIRPTKWQGGPEDVTEMFKALSGLQTLYSSHCKLLYPGSIIHRLTSQEMPLWKTLEVVRFDHINVWGEDRIVQLNLHRERTEENEDGQVSKYTVENGLLTGSLARLDIRQFHAIPEVTNVVVTTRDFEDDGDTEGDADWVDEDAEVEGEEWSDDDDEYEYESESEDSEWDSEDDSDYEDDWEAEYGFSVPSTQPVLCKTDALFVFTPSLQPSLPFPSEFARHPLPVQAGLTNLTITFGAPAVK